MKSWRGFVGRVARLRRSIVRLVAWAERPRGRAEEAEEYVAVADEHAPGPPAHWVERVRRGAPGLLEPSLRQRGAPAEAPATDGVVRSPAEHEPQPHSFEQPTELEPQPYSLEQPASDEPQREEVPREAAGRPRLPIAPVRRSPLRKVLRRRRSPSAVPQAVVRASPAPMRDDVPRELYVDEQIVREAADSPAATRADHERPVVENEPTPIRPSPRVADQTERSPRHSEVVEFEAPTQRRSVGIERAVPPQRRVARDVAPLPAAEPTHAALEVGGAAPDRVQARSVAPPAPRLASDAVRVREPAFQPSPARPEQSAQPRPHSRVRDEALFTADIDRWPELPPPLDEADGGVDVALRVWERQRRLDREQTRL